MGLAEQEAAPKTPEELSKRLNLLARFPSLDGRNQRPALADEVAGRWPSFVDKLQRHGLDAALAAFPGWIAEVAAKHKRAWEAEGNGDVAAISRPPPELPPRPEWHRKAFAPVDDPPTPVPPEAN
jgi:hypothetical protein